MEATDNKTINMTGLALYRQDLPHRRTFTACVARKKHFRCVTGHASIRCLPGNCYSIPCQPKSACKFQCL